MAELGGWERAKGGGGVDERCGGGEGADLPQVGSRGEHRIPMGLGGVGQVASFGGKGRGGGGGVRLSDNWPAWVKNSENERH